MGKKIIAIIGRAGSGKNVSWDYFSQKFWIPIYTISSSLRIIAQERWLEDTRENLITLWKELKKTHGDSYLAEVLVENCESDMMIIVGMRQIGQIMYCKNSHQTLFLWIQSNSEIRYERLKKNWKFSEDYLTFQAVEKLDEWEVQNVWKCLEYSDIMIENNGSLEEFYKKLESLDL